LFTLRPTPDRGGSCPRCDHPLRLRRLRIAGWRMLADGDCERCGHRYLQDLPAGHGLMYPATLDVGSGEVFQSGDGPWFADALRPMWELPDTEPVALTVERSGDGGPAVLLNCLDKIYGHALLKLLNVSRHLDDGRRAVIVLIPASLRELVPAGVAETWIVDEPTPRFERWLVDLETQAARELDRLGDCVLSEAFPHPHPSTYSLDALVGAVASERLGDPTIVLSLRADRSWGRDPRRQAANVERLWRRLSSAFPGARCAAIGAAAPGGLPDGVDDLTSTRPDRETERRWLGLLRGADLAIGVHGSNLLLPTGLARASIELLPAERYGNALQATLPSSPDSVTALIRHRTLYGSDDLSDVTPERVAAVAISVLRERERMEQVLAGPAAGIGTAQPGPPSRLRQVALPPRVSLRAIRPGPVLRRAGRTLEGASAAARQRLQARRGPRRRPALALPAVVRDERGLAFELETADEVERFLGGGGHVEQSELRLLSAYLDRGMTALDVGANLGVFTATFASRVGERGAVHSFEPLPSTRRRLQRTVALNGLDRVVVNDSAVADREGEVELHEYGPGYESWATVAPREIETAGGILRTARHLTVGVVTVDRYCERHGIERVDVLKIDVEGAEEQVLRGASGMLSRGAIDLVMVEVADTTLLAAGGHAHEVLDLLEQSGLWPFAIDGIRLHPFRVAGRQLALANVVAASAPARERLRRLGLLSPG
jgi:FkbM family methyltransferase